MPIFQFLIAFLGVLVLLLVIFVILNIYQNGPVREVSALPPPEEILPIPQDAVVLDDLLNLSKREVFELYQQLPSVPDKKLHGEYTAYNLPQGVLSPVINMITDHLFGSGRWVGKGFFKTTEVWQGYNIFRVDENTYKRERPFKIVNSVSEIDGRSCIRLDYRDLNHDLIAGSMRDELRMINMNVFLGMGMTSWGLGSINPAHFILIRSSEFDLIPDKK